MWLRNVCLWGGVCAAAACGAASAPAESPGPAGQTYREAIELICEVDQRAGIHPDGDPLESDQRRSDFINERVENPDGIELRTLLSVMAPAKKAASLREEARDRVHRGVTAARDSDGSRKSKNERTTLAQKTGHPHVPDGARPRRLRSRAFPATGRRISISTGPATEANGAFFPP